MIRPIDEAGLTLIKQYEGCVLKAYQDVAGIWTIGYGHTKGVFRGMHITRHQADQALLDDLRGAESVVGNATSDAPTSDNEFSAMVSLCFNIGSLNFRASTVLRDHLAQDYSAAGEAFLLWDKARIGGVLEAVQGLINRRKAERALYLTP